MGWKVRLGFGGEMWVCVLIRFVCSALQYLEACVELREPVYPSAVLMDMEMPILYVIPIPLPLWFLADELNRDGVNATMRIREWEADKRLPEPRMPIYAVTGNARQGQVDTALLSGMDRVYLKRQSFLFPLFAVDVRADVKGV